MATTRIHITGGSGCGVTTLGAALAMRLSFPHHDTDNFYWRPTAPPFMEKREVTDRLRLMQEMFLPRSDWVLSGSLGSWASPVWPLIDFVVFLRVSTEVRIARLRAREEARLKRQGHGPGSEAHAELEEFLEWASHYDDGSREGRTLAGHDDWLARLTCPVLRLDGARPTDDLVAEVLAALYHSS